MDAMHATNQIYDFKKNNENWFRANCSQQLYINLDKWFLARYQLTIYSLFISWTAPNFHSDRLTFSNWSRVWMWCFYLGLSSQFHITTHWIKICVYINAVEWNDKFIKVAPADGSFSAFTITLRLVFVWNWWVFHHKIINFDKLGNRRQK